MLKFDYLIKSFEVLASATYAYIEFYTNEDLDIWDRVFYDKELFQSKYEKKEVSHEFSKNVRQIYERLTRV